MKFVVIGSVIMNQYSVLQFVRVSPSTIAWMTEHKIYVCLMSFFFSNFLETQLMSTSAFEVYFNGWSRISSVVALRVMSGLHNFPNVDLPLSLLTDIRIWSKLQTGRVPTPGELVQIIDQEMKNSNIRYAETSGFDTL